MTQTDARPLYFEIFAVAFACILLEISYTRIFSFKVYYFFTYVVIGVALLGLGAGGVLYAVSPRLNEAPPRRLVPAACFAAAATVLAGYLVIALTPLHVSELSRGAGETAKLALACVVLVVPYVCAGVVISMILATRPAAAGRLYGTDLLGAALACVLAVPLLDVLTPPGAVMAAGALLAAAGVRLAAGAPAAHGAAATLIAVLGTLAAFPGVLPDPVTDRVKQLAQAREAGLVLFSRWSPIFRVDVAHHALQPDAGHMIYHDGQLGAGLPHFDGDFAKLGHFERGSRALPFTVLDEPPRVLIIGSAGGHEILASLFHGAEHVTGVELNPVTVSLLTEHFADFSGRLAEHPKVTIVNAEGRSFLRRSRETYDLIWFVAPDSYASMNAASSGGYVLSESYLYSVEAVRDALDHLTPGGIVAAQFGERDFERKPNRTSRYLGTARAAFEDRGVEDFGRHVLVASGSAFAPMSEATILLSPRPFGAQSVRRFLAHLPDVLGGTLRYAPGERVADGPVPRIVESDGEALERWYDTYAYDVTPVRDDSPFFWHFVRFRDALGAESTLRGVSIDWEDAIGEQTMLALLAIVTVLAAVFLLLPFAAIGETWRGIPHKAQAVAYFAALGVGFMFIEVCLIQMLTLFLGYPTYSLSVTLFAILVFSGLGSLASERWTRRRNRSLLLLVVALGLLLALVRLGLPLAVERFGGAPLAARVAVAALLIAPLGLCLGSFLPLGLRTLAATTPHQREYLAWGWAVNGFFSVISSVLCTILTMAVGFGSVLWMALGVYALGAAALSRIPEADAGG